VVLKVLCATSAYEVCVPPSRINAPFDAKLHSVKLLTDGETVKSIEEPDVNPNALALNDDIVPRMGIILSKFG
jgi:hypothetical protein